MKCVGMCLFAAAMAMAAGAFAQDEAEAAKDRTPFGIPSAPTAAASAAKAAPRPGMFAAASAAIARRMSPEQRDERQFLKLAAANGRFEFEAARMAMGKTGNPAVRSFASTVVAHQSSMLPALQYMLHSRGMAPPMLANDQRMTLNRLAKLGGAKFDREFLDKVGLRSQQADLQLFERAGAAAKDPALKAWIEKVLPNVKTVHANAERAASAEVKLVRSGLLPVPARRPAGRAAPSSQADQVPGTSTQAMGAAPALPAAAQPVAAQPSESNSR